LNFQNDYVPPHGVWWWQFFNPNTCCNGVIL